MSRADIVADIQERVAEHFGFTRLDLVSTRRGGQLAKARHIAMALCRVHLGLSLETIGFAFGDRHHAGVSKGIKQGAAELGISPKKPRYSQPVGEISPGNPQAYQALKASIEKRAA